MVQCSPRAGSRSGERAAASPPLMAYVGTFSSPLKDVLPTQVDLPPGNGRGIHLFRSGSRDRRADAGRRARDGHEPELPGRERRRDAALLRQRDRPRRRREARGRSARSPIDRADGKLTLLNTVRSGGAGPTYVSVHPSGTVPARRQLLRRLRRGAADPARRHGSGAATDVKNDDGQDRPDAGDERPARQLRLQRPRPDARAHDPGRPRRPLRAARRPRPRPDLRLEVRRPRRACSTPNDPPAVSLPPGDGPRHFHFHPNGRWFYSIQEEGSTVVLFDYDAATGRLTARQTISTLPPGFAGSNFCSEILVSADGRFVYAGNRLHDSIGDLRRRRRRHADVRRRGMDARQLPAQLQLRPDRPVPLLLQPARRQRRRLPGGSQDRRPRRSPATTRRSAIRRSSCFSTSATEVEPQNQSRGHACPAPHSGQRSGLDRTS